MTSKAKANIKSDEFKYDFSGLNLKYANVLDHGHTQEEIDQANVWASFWHDHIGVEVIPCDSKQKGLWALKEYSNENVKYYENDVPSEYYEHWRETGAFVHGIAVLCGKIRRGDYKGR